MTLDELARQTAARTNGHDQHRAEGADLLEVAVIAVEKAVYWSRPETCHEGMFESGVRIATLRANVALAVELRALRQELAKFRQIKLRPGEDVNGEVS
jgi:hypothetical protein